MRPGRCVRGDARRSEGEAREEGEEGQGEASTARLSAANERGKIPVVAEGVSFQRLIY